MRTRSHPPAPARIRRDIIAFGVRPDQTKPAGEGHLASAHRDRNLYIGPQFQLADADLLAGNPVANIIGERLGAILDPARIGVGAQARAVRAPVIPVVSVVPGRHCNLTFHPDLRKQPLGVERPGSYPKRRVNEPDVVIGLPVKQAAFKIHGPGVVARGKIGARKPAGAINRVGRADLSRPIMIREIKLQHRPRKEVFGIFPVNAERAQNRLCDRFCVAGLAAGPGP